MKNYFELEQIYNLDQVLATVECYCDNPKYKKYKKVLTDLLMEYLPLMKPKGYTVKTASNRFLPAASLDAVYCLVTLGKDIEDVINEKFKEYEYLEVMMLNALSDQILFAATDDLYNKLSVLVEKNKRYLTKRYEPGNTEVPIEYQKTLFDVLKNEWQHKISMTEGYMISPTKSTVYFYGLTETDYSGGLDHDCSLCEQKNCPHRKSV